MRSTQLLALLAVHLLLGGCSSGQTGSPDCPGPVNCVCDPLYAPGPLLRVHGESADADGNGHLVAVVDEVFSLHPTDIQVGDRVGGSIMREKSCDPDYHADNLVGADSFVMFFPGSQGNYPNCSAFQSCASAQCEGLAEPQLTDCWSTCSTQTQVACEADRQAALLDGAFSWVIPWGDTFDFGGAGHQLPRADMSVLENVDTCVARFPSSAASPCQDTIHGGPCTISTTAPDVRNPYGWLGALALLGMAAVSRRWSRLRAV